MANNSFDICILGGGVSGIFAALKIAQLNKNKRILLIEAGKAARKRRHQMFSFLGLLPNSNGRLYLNDLQTVEEITSAVKTKAAFKWFNFQTKDILNLKVIKDAKPSINCLKKIAKSGFEVKLNDHIQLYPPEIHTLSKHLSDKLENKVECLFDTEVISLNKEKNSFIIETDEDTYQAKKVLLCIGRAGWKKCHELFTNLDIVAENNYATIGIRIELDESHINGFNESSCNIFNKFLKIGPIQNFGTMVPEDQISFVTSNFRGNENRWKSSKISFNLYSDRYFKGRGVEEAERLGCLAFILTNDRICKERISTLLAGKSKLSVLKEFEWLGDAIKELSNFIPDLITYGNFYFPTIHPMTSTVKLKNNFECEDMSGLFVSGESARVPGLLGAAVSGIIAGTEILK